MLGVHERRICLISPGEREVCAAAAFAGLGWKAGSFVSRVVYTQAGQAGSLSLEDEWSPIPPLVCCYR